MKDYIALFSEIPAHHSGRLIDQIHRAATMATPVLRANGLPLPGETKLPLQSEVRRHLAQLVNGALESYFSTKNVAPKNAKPSEIWGEDGDSLFSVVVSGVDDAEKDGFTAEIDLNLLYDGEDAAYAH